MTGGAGYIGSHACKALSKSGFIPVVYDNLSTGNVKSIKWGPFVRGDIQESKKLLSVLRRYKPIGVMHFAALTAARDSIQQPSEYYESNLIGTKRLLDVCIKENIKKFIFSSSAAVYGAPKKIPISEESASNPLNPYGETKLAIECMLASYSRAYDLNYIALRYFNAAGADPDAKIGSYQKKPTNLIPRVMEVLAKKKRELPIFGTDYATRDGTALRDYIHVSDLASAHVQSLNLLLQTTESHSLNLGTGRGYTVFEVIAAAEKISGKKIHKVLKARAEGDCDKLVADSRKAQKLLHWKPVHENIEDIITTAFSWAMKREHL